MINVFVPVTEKPDEFAKFIQDNSKTQVKFYVGITESLAAKFPKLKNAEIHVFKNGTNREKILNSLHKLKLKKGKLLVVRRPLTANEFAGLCDSQADMTRFKTHHNKFVSFFKNLARKIIKKVFAFTYFDDISAVMYNENLFELITACSNLSMATRIDRYVGIEIAEINSEDKPAKRHYNKALNVFWLIFGIMLLIGSFVGGGFILACVPNIWAVYVLLIMTWWILAIISFCIVLIRFTRAVAVGDLNYEYGEEITK